MVKSQNANINYFYYIATMFSRIYHYFPQFWDKITLHDARCVTESVPFPFDNSFNWGVSAGDAHHVLYIISRLFGSGIVPKSAAVLFLQLGVH